MFLIDVIKPNAERNSKLVEFLRDCLEELRAVGIARNKTSFVSFRVRLGGGNKNFIQNKRENIIIRAI